MSCTETYTHGIITLDRGDSLQIPIVINQGTPLRPNIYHLQEGDTLYVGIMEPNKMFECSIVKKVYTKDSPMDNSGNVLFTMKPEDSEFLLPGTYYFSAKLVQRRYDQYGTQIAEEVTTVVPKRLFYIV